MRGLFVRIYGGVAAVIVGALLLAGAWGWARRVPPGRWVELAEEAPVRVEAAFRAEDEAEALAALRAELDAEVDVVRTDEVPPPVRARLARGFPVLPVPGAPPDLFVPLADGRVVAVRPRHLPEPLLLPLAVGGVVGALGLVLAGLLRPLDRDLGRLSAAAGRIGAGDLRARAHIGERAALADIGARFDAMADRVGALLGAREQLLLAVSHELRHPLQRLRFGVELLVDADDAERARLADGVQRDLDALDELVEELLAFGRADAIAPRVERLRAGPVLRRAAARAPSVEVGDDAELLADPTLLQRAVDNLVANALRHARGRVRIAAAPGRVDVDDDGPGVPVAERQRVLEPFVRLGEARERDGGGVGLGLALVDRIARAHGGRVEIGDSPLGGARVTLHLPDER